MSTVFSSLAWRAAMATMASRISAADGKRSTGALASARASTASSSARRVRSGRRTASGAASALTWRLRISRVVEATNGVCATSSSYRMMPTAYRSAANAGGAPVMTSGAMYSGVPHTVRSSPSRGACTRRAMSRSVMVRPLRLSIQNCRNVSPKPMLDCRKL